MRRSFALVVSLAGASCTLLAPSDAELRGTRPLGSADAGDGLPSNDAAVESWNDLSTPTYWTKFDTTTILPSAKSFAGGSFDGRYVYLAPNANGIVARYDTQAPFGTNDSWQLFDASSVDEKASAFRGAAFDGRWVYFVPHGDRSGSVVARYDTQGTFGAATAWSTFDTNLVDARAEGFESAVFDGRYLYFVPNQNEYGDYVGVVARYDTASPFGSAGSWAIFDTRSVDIGANGYMGGVFDGQYVYFVPRDNGYPDAVVARLDTAADFHASTSWGVFPVDKRQAGAGTFSGGAFDGRYVYMAPTALGNVLRYDTQGPFSTAWALFPLSRASVAGKFAGCAFDGRYVHLVPGDQTSLVVRVDSRAPFDEASSWSSFDLKQIDSGATSFVGAVFDGQYLYFVPNAGGLVVRFEAKTSRSALRRPALQASFF
jgi:hypothetical protein